METEIALPTLKELRKDLRAAAVSLGPAEARYLVDLYYQIQEYRISTSNQSRALGETNEPGEAIRLILAQMDGMERAIQSALDRWTDEEPMGAWAKGHIGIGPVIAAGLAAHIDVTKTETVGGLWRFAGVDPSQKWLGAKAGSKLVTDAFKLRDDTEAIEVIAGESKLPVAMLTEVFAEGGRAALAARVSKRPYNAKLKVLVWKIGESFSRQRHRDNAWYAHKLAERKEYETRQNEAGAYSEQAKAIMDRRGYSKGTGAWATLEEGKLPPAMIEQRARRWAAKLFLAHYWEEGRKQKGLPVPAPYPVEHMGHAHTIPAPAPVS